MSDLSDILYVEDDPDIQAVVQLALETLGGFSLHTCSSGADALEALETRKPQLVLLDVMMPDLDGPTTLQKLRRMPNGRDVPVIFMTARAQKKEIGEYKALGAIGVISKPFDPMTLAQTVRSLWAGGR